MSWRDRIHVGTSGWHYDHWVGPFYPEKMDAAEFLAFYRRKFNTVEINNSFYNLPDEKTLAEWAGTASGNFVFSVKGSRYITHMKKLKDSSEPVSRFLERTSALGPKRGPVLFQLPPRWKRNLERLEEFLSRLPRGRYVFEFRDPSWFGAETEALLKEYGASFCIYDLKGSLSPVAVTAGFVYIRLHGPSAEAYQGRYERQALSGWAGRMSSWARSELDVYCYFDNDQKGYAALNALELQEMLRGD